MESESPEARRYEFELLLEELCIEWEAVDIDTTNIHRGIDEYHDALGTAEHLVGTGAEGFNAACRELGSEMTIEALIVSFADIADPAVVATARQRLNDAASS